MKHDDESTGRLLDEVFSGTRVGGADYLRWLYRESPFGAVIETNVDDDQGRSAHYAVVPFVLDAPEGEVPVALSLNTAVAERARGGGVFVGLANRTLDAAREAGVRAVLGVANANSTPGFLRRLSFTLIGPLPATVMIPRPGRGPKVVSAACSAIDVAHDAGVAAVLDAATSTVRGVHPRWTPTTLAWRLASPGADYALHRLPGALVISTRERRAGLSVAVLMAVITDHELERRELDAIVRAACRHHRAPVALHVGINALAPVRGVPLPARLRPSPLNLIFRWIDDRRAAAPHIGRFELLDFDAY